MKNTKTFYEVVYSVMGRNEKEHAYFDNKKEAYDFYNSRNYIDKPKAHVISNPDTIKKYESLVYMTFGNIPEFFESENIKKEAEEIAKKIRSIDTWDPDLNFALCELAGIEEEYKAADDDFERVVEKAADILGVEIY